MMTKEAISWKSVKQTLIASSTIEVEFIACFKVSNQGIWLWNFITRLHYIDCVEKPLKNNVIIKPLVIF